MPASKSRGGTTKKRTHNLGGCATCRRRHVKCDQARPACATCRKAKLDCGGFPSQIRWASMSYGPSRPTEAPEENTTLPNVSKNTGGSQAEVSLTKDQNLPVSDSVSSNNGPHAIQQDGQDSRLIPSPASLSIGTDSMSLAVDSESASFLPQEPNLLNHSSVGSLSDLESLFESSNGLIWNDLFDTTFDMSMPLIQDQLYDPTYSDPLSLLAHAAHQPQSYGRESQSLDYASISNQSYEKQNTSAMNRSFDPQDTPHALTDLEEAQVLKDAHYLLKHFRDTLIPQFGPLPMSCKSPWETLMWNNAVQTHAELTWLQGSNVKHANKANLFALLGCSAHIVAKAPPVTLELDPVRGMQILEYASKRAKRHMQESLRLETAGDCKAKYKDQLMAIFSLIALATETGNAADARCYLIDAERLVRLRGITKQKTSRRARLLHHVYTWQRIIGESTFVLHDHKNSLLQSKIERTFRDHARTPTIGSCATNQYGSTSHENSQLDDFLRIRSHGTDSDDDAETQKDNETGLRDIHLEDARPWSNTLYMDIYGIPEIWLSYVSQTTRVANIMDYLDETSVQPTRTFQECLQRKTTQLENRICTLSAQYSNPGEQSPPLSNGSGLTMPKPTVASRAMMRAMSSALLILFYRRIRKVHPFILQAHVNDVIAALKDFDLAHDACDNKAPGTPWPAFIAGTEAMSVTARDWLMSWMQKGAVQSAFNGFTASQQVMREVWNQRDIANKNLEKDVASPPEQRSTGRKRKDAYSWVDVLRENNSWLMLY
ncbi:fungal-specific transcription factor domain-containing protein [Boeremia exigua]|uniref:fungal-specific transcription factor domain-containing protein n=1 Tax=Boeremia exigua TaxID=749465 RepID=UPI001E8D8289|nr:fungal-specific transcription factor domain-containing protein [Boeremia exigua]KAH6633191.1 fungal-specific transcription factor domain-containing protein [Boeremia exigua]